MKSALTRATHETTEPQLRQVSNREGSISAKVTSAPCRNRRNKAPDGDAKDAEDAPEHDEAVPKQMPRLFNTEIEVPSREQMAAAEATGCLRANAVLPGCSGALVGARAPPRRRRSCPTRPCGCTSS